MGSAKVLVLSCIDPRYTAILNWFLTNYKTLENDYDLFVLAGGSLGYNQANGSEFAPMNSTTNVTYNTANTKEHWATVFKQHINLAKLLHGITEIWVFDHMDCGAFNYFLEPVGTETVQLHYGSIRKFIELVETDYGTLNFKGFLIDQTATIRLTHTKTNDPATAINVDPMPTGKVNYFIVTLIGILVFLIFYNIT
jgi:hypothetical protein